MLAELLTIATVSNCVPALPDPMVGRDNLTQEIDDASAAGATLVIVEGDEGTGKTSLLSAFVAERPNSLASIFVSGTNRWSYQPELILRDMCNQLSWACANTVLGIDEAVDLALLARLVYALQSKARRSKRQFYFVVDGLDEIPAADQQVKNEIISYIPISRPPFVVVSSLSVGEPQFLSMKGVRSRTVSVPKFSLEETKRLFVDETTDQQLIETLHRTFKGMPGKLAEVRRFFVEREEDIRDVFSDPGSESLNELFERMWEDLDLSNPVMMSMLGVLAHDRKKYSIDELATVIERESHEVITIGQSVSLLEVGSADQSIGFVSETIQRFVAGKLANQRDSALGTVIRSLLSRSEDDRIVVALPRYLEQAGRFQELLDYLSPEHIGRLLEVSQSLSPVRTILEFGTQAATRLNQDAKLFQFSLQRCALTELAVAEVGIAEVEARLELEDYSGALALVQGTIVKEDRLQLFALIAKVKRTKGLQLEPEIASEIERLLTEIDFENLGLRSVDIAADLLLLQSGNGDQFGRARKPIGFGRKRAGFRALASFTHSSSFEQE
jgi:hypothetical protein